MLIVLYLFAPAASVFLREAPEKHLWFLIALWFFWASLLPLIDKPLNFETYFTPDMDDYFPLIQIHCFCERGIDCPCKHCCLKGVSSSSSGCSRGNGQSPVLRLIGRVAVCARPS